jgi:hypothetical protein
MKDKNKIILFVVLISIAFSLSLGFKKYVVDKDFFVYMHAPCTEIGQSCFVLDDERYIKVYRKAYKVEECSKGACDPFVCQESESDCQAIICSEDQLKDGEVCEVNNEIKE